MNKTESQLQKELLETVQEVGELLKKSGLAKAEDDELSEVPEESEDLGSNDINNQEEQVQDNIQPAPVDEQPAPEGEEGDMSEEMASHASELSDEELQAMLEVLMAEVEKRHAASGGANAEAAPAQEPEPMAASMKKEFSSLAKSVADIAEAVKNLNGEVSSLKKSSSEKKQTVITSKPANVNQNVQILQKSNTPKEKLNKSDTLQYLISEQRNGNKKINSDVVATISACKTDEALAHAQKDLEKLGINIPTV